MPCDSRKAHQFEKGGKLRWLRMGELDKLKAVGPHRIVIRYGCRRAIVRERPHLQSLLRRTSSASYEGILGYANEVEAVPSAVLDLHAKVIEASERRVTTDQLHK